MGSAGTLPTNRDQEKKTTNPHQGLCDLDVTLSSLAPSGSLASSFKISVSWVTVSFESFGRLIGVRPRGSSVSVRRTLEVEEPPAKTLAALATAAENLGYEVRRVDLDHGVAVAASPWTREAASLGFILTAWVRAPQPPTTLVELDVTPRLGSWAVKGAKDRVQEIRRELHHVLQAPKARIRRPSQAGRPDRPFGFRPEIAGSLWALSSLAVYGVLVGGLWWIPAVVGFLGGALLAYPWGSRAWALAVALAGTLSLPFGALGLVYRREGLAHAYWRQVTSHSDPVKADSGQP